MRNKQMTLFPELASELASRVNNEINRIDLVDHPFHDWYRFVLAFPPHLVRQYLTEWQIDGNATLLDPFCGTGTSVLEAKLNNVLAVGLEMNPVAAFASTVKTSFSVDYHELEDDASKIYDLLSSDRDDSIPVELSLNKEASKLLIRDSISRLPLQKVLRIRYAIKHLCTNSLIQQCFLLALAKIAVTEASNLRFGPEIGVGKYKHDAAVYQSWLDQVLRMAEDLRTIEGRKYPESQIIRGDARIIDKVVADNMKFDTVFTSPPYPNEKDYTRTTRLELVLLDFIQNLQDLRAIKKGFVRSNTRSVYHDDKDHLAITNNRRVTQLAEKIEARRVSLGKTSGFEKQYPRVVLQYFGGIKRHLAGLRAILKPKARLGYVVGDQASYLGVMIHTGEILAEIASELGYELEKIDLFRLRAATTTRSELREEVVVLRWTG